MADNTASLKSYTPYTNPASGERTHIQFNTAATATDQSCVVNDLLVSAGDLHIGTISTPSTLAMTYGANCVLGDASFNTTVAYPVCTVWNSRVTANSKIFLTCQGDGGGDGAGPYYVSTKTPGVGFQIQSQYDCGGGGSEKGLLAYLIVEPIT
jgi:hypothetical protein